MIRIAATFLLIGLLATPTAAQEKFTISIRKDAKGDVLKVTESDVEKGKMKISFMGMEMPKDEDKGYATSYQEKVVDKEVGKRATKLTRTYDKAEITKDGQVMKASFVGKPVEITRTGDVYKYTVEGKDLTGIDAEILALEFKDKKKDEDGGVEDLLLPRGPVAVNDTWKPDLAVIIKEFSKDAGGLTIDQAKSTSSAKLVKAYKKDGKQYGLIEIELGLALQNVGAGAMKIDLEAGSLAKITFRFDGCIDGTANVGKMEVVMAMNMKGKLKTPDGVEVGIDANLRKNQVKTQEVVK